MNELTLFEQKTNNMYCSKSIANEEEKKALFNSLEGCDVLLNDCVGAQIKIKDVYCEARDVVDEETGEVKKKYRTILFDVDGKTYATGSYGIYNVISKIIAIYGQPTWEEGLAVEVTKRPIGNGKQALTLKLM